MRNKEMLVDAWELINELADETTKEKFELDDILYDISMKIFDFRTKKGWTQKQLAERLGIKQAMVSKLESGQYNPTIEQLWKISKKLKWDFKVILEEKDEIETQIWDTFEVAENQDDELSENKLVVGA